MCDYSLHAVASRPARLGEKLVSTKFPMTVTRGFTGEGEPNVAVCVRPGTELAFEREVEYDGRFSGRRFVIPSRGSGPSISTIRTGIMTRWNFPTGSSCC